MAQLLTAKTKYPWGVLVVQTLETSKEKFLLCLQQDNSIWLSTRIEEVFTVEEIPSGIWKRGLKFNSYSTTIFDIPANLDVLPNQIVSVLEPELINEADFIGVEKRYTVEDALILQMAIAQKYGYAYKSLQDTLYGFLSDYQASIVETNGVNYA